MLGTCRSSFDYSMLIIGPRSLAAPVRKNCWQASYERLHSKESHFAEDECEAHPPKRCLEEISGAKQGPCHEVALGKKSSFYFSVQVKDENRWITKFQAIQGPHGGLGARYYPRLPPSVERRTRRHAWGGPD